MPTESELLREAALREVEDFRKKFQEASDIISRQGQRLKEVSAALESAQRISTIHEDHLANAQRHNAELAKQVDENGRALATAMAELEKEKRITQKLSDQLALALKAKRILEEHATESEDIAPGLRQRVKSLENLCEALYRYAMQE